MRFTKKAVSVRQRNTFLIHRKTHKKEFEAKGLKAYISVNKALVTQSSAAIPIVPLLHFCFIRL